MELSGYLSPDGVFTECPYWCHSLEAERICKEKYGKDFGSAIASEDYLYDQGYVGFYNRSANHKFVVDGKIVLLTSKQLDFIFDNLDNANNEEQRAFIENLIACNSDYSESLVLHHYENQIMT